MAKRGPQRELNDRNWDDEEEPEEAGIFKKASTDTMQHRVIKKAKRRGGQEEGGMKTGAFGGFGGLITKPPSLLTQDKATDKTTGSLKAPSLGDSGFFTGGATSSVDNNIESSKSEMTKDNSAYLHALKSLNESVLAWIKQHVDKNPYIILTPIFKDYEKYHATLEAKKTTTNGSSSAFSGSGKQSEMKTFSSITPIKSLDEKDLKKDAGKEEDKEATKTPLFAFGSVSSSNGDGFKFSSAAATTTTSGFTFGKTTTSSISTGFSFAQSISSSATKTTAAETTGFSFGGTIGTKPTLTPSLGTAGFSFKGLAAAKATADNAQAGGSQDDDAEYVPPKPDVKEIKEEGSLFSKRCKLFYQKEGNWTERGVGNVHVKPLEGSKTQLLVRADTNLGNILLNINLTSGLPTSRQGKNNVLLVCVPNPPLKDGDGEKTPIPMLIRVKTADEADELLAKLEERKALL